MAILGSQVTTGAKLEISIGNQILAYANNVSYDIAHNSQDIEVIGEPTVKEIAELGITIQFTCTSFRVARQSCISLGISPKISNFLQQPELTATIRDKEQDVVLLTLKGLKLVNRSGNSGARESATEVLTFRGRLYSDEA